MIFDIDNYSPNLCPFCESNNIYILDSTAETEKCHCHDCSNDYLLVYDEPHDEMPIEVLDRHGHSL